jgi:hypothetical protein
MVGWHDVCASTPGTLASSDVVPKMATIKLRITPSVSFSYF